MELSCFRSSQGPRHSNTRTHLTGKSTINVNLGKSIDEIFVD